MVVISTASRLLAIVAGQIHKPGTDTACMSDQEYGIVYVVCIVDSTIG